MLRVVKNLGHLLIAVLANVYYGFPSRKIDVIGVTGTDGKTTTTSMIYHILNDSGRKAAMITSVGAYINGKQYDIGFHVTTPSAIAVQKYLRQAVDSGHDVVVLETTSHGLDQHRSWGVKFTAGVLTNITPEHLDYHKTYERYADAKIKLLLLSDVAIVNMDDDSFGRVSVALAGRQMVTYSSSKRSADIHPKTYPIKTSLVGSFNIQNSLAAVAACIHVGVPKKQAIAAMNTYTPPAGRQEIVQKKPFTVMVDFAHTSGSFEGVLPEVRKLAKKRMIHVFGSAAKRDVFKRPIMGKWAAENDDVIILTAEDPRNESIVDICKDIARGMKHVKSVAQEHLPFSNGDRVLAKKELERLESETNILLKKKKPVVLIIPDRAQAIGFAIDIAEDGDYVLTTGKSHEKSMNYGAGEEPWDEFAVIKRALKKKS